jgi:hypothetical protein
VSTPTPEFPDEVLAAAEAAVRDQPGITSADLEHVIPVRMLASGHPAVIMSRDRAKAIMRVLEGQGRIERRTGQARVEFYLAQTAPRPGTRPGPDGSEVFLPDGPGNG